MYDLQGSTAPRSACGEETACLGDELVLLDCRGPRKTRYVVVEV